MLLLTYILPLLALTALFGLLLGRSEAETAFGTALLFSNAIFLFCAYTWTTGVIGALVMTSPFICCGTYAVCTKFKELVSKGGGSSSGGSGSAVGAPQPEE